MQKVLLAFLGLVFVGCASFSTSAKPVAQSPKEVELKPSMETFTEYVAYLPCGDCDGINSKLSLDVNGHFTKVDEYDKEVNGKKLAENTFVTKGKYVMMGDILVAKGTNGDEFRFKKVGKNLVQVSMDGSMPSDVKSYTFKLVK